MRVGAHGCILPGCRVGSGFFRRQGRGRWIGRESSGDRRVSHVDTHCQGGAAALAVQDIDDAEVPAFKEGIEGAPGFQLTGVVTDNEELGGLPGEPVRKEVAVQIAGQHGPPDGLTRGGVGADGAYAGLGEGELRGIVGNGRPQIGVKEGLSGLGGAVAVGVAGLHPEEQAEVFRRGRIGGGMGTWNILPGRLVGRNGPLPGDMGNAAVGVGQDRVKHRTII
ncbi:MAG: hypothetical protein OXR67_06595 [Chloroflexota bacterium]|nr:hypothetical protein [Chloroflexota bacterium]